MSESRCPGFWLPERARDALKAAVMGGTDSLDLVIVRLRAEHPEAFHSKESLLDRVFVHEPTQGEPHHRGAVARLKFLWHE